jgi:hypothetical protein
MQLHNNTEECSSTLLCGWSQKSQKFFMKSPSVVYWLWAGLFRDRTPVGARFSAPAQTGTGSFPGVKSGRGVTLTPHHLLVPWSWKSRAIPLLPLWAIRPVQSLGACTSLHFTLPYCSFYFSIFIVVLTSFIDHIFLFFTFNAIEYVYENLNVW